MSRKDELYHLSKWNAIVSQEMHHLSKCQVRMLAILSFGIAACRYCGLTTISVFIAKLLNKDENAMYKRVREWHYDAKDKSGNKRRQVDVENCFAPLASWIMKLWHSMQLVIILDATSLGDRFTVLSVSIAYRGFAIPIAWKILAANTRHPWKEEWLRLLDYVKPAIPQNMEVFVMTDRGLYAKWLFKHIEYLDWIPFMRINEGGFFRPSGQHSFRHLSSFVRQPGTHWFGTGTAFKNKPGQFDCTLLAWWGPQSDEAWLILTSVVPEACDPGFYSLRCWIERGFRTTKRGGLSWHHTKMTDPIRASRLWLCISLALIWLASIATEDDVENSEITFSDSVEKKRLQTSS